MIDGQNPKRTASTHMGTVVKATWVYIPGMNPRRARIIILLLSLCMALQMTSFGIIFPIFARRLGDFGDGVEALAIMTMAFSLAGIVGAPFMGSLADRFGRRPMLLGSLMVYVIAYTGYLFSTSTGMFIGIRAAAGALTAGLAPATMGIIADIAPKDERARWIGILGGGTSVGIILGPLLGGFLYDQWGYVAPFVVSAGIAFIALLVAFFMVPETHSQEGRRRDTLHNRRAAERIPASTPDVSFWASLPRPLLAFGVLLFVNLSIIFAWFFIDPQLPFYVFEELGWTTAQYGMAVSGYGWASLFGQMVLGQLSDRYGRKLVLVLGLFLHSAQYVGLTLSKTPGIILLSFLIAGLGEALLVPAMNASILDITPEQHRARVMGIKGAVGSLGSLSAPALVMVFIRFIPPESVFLISAGVILITSLLVFFALKLPGRVVEETPDLSWEVSRQRTLAAQASLRSVVLSATTARKLKE
jgi:DHA1 family multidrug resistance protein-like MFS transporter